MKSRGMKSRGMKLMKHWCYYANVVRYLEKLEANAVKKKKRGAYLVWRDDEGPHMIAGPDIYWHRGAGPMPDLAGPKVSIRPTGAARVGKRSAPAVLSTPEKANKTSTTFPRSAQICSPKQQSRRRQSAVKTAANRPNTQTATSIPGETPAAWLAENKGLRKVLLRSRGRKSALKTSIIQKRATFSASENRRRGLALG